MININDELVELFENCEIDYNSTVVFRLSRMIEDLIDNGTLSLSDEDAADKVEFRVIAD